MKVLKSVLGSIADVGADEPALVATACLSAAAWIVATLHLSMGATHAVDLGLLAAVGVFIRSNVTPVRSALVTTLESTLSSTGDPTPPNPIPPEVLPNAVSAAQGHTEG